MKWLLRTRDVLNSFYAKYDKYLDGLGRFVFALLAYITIIFNTGYNVTISNPFLAVVLALISAFLPLSATSIFSAVLITLEFSSVCVEVAAIALVFFVLILLLYFVFRAQSSYLMILSLVLCLWSASPVLLPMALLIEPIDVLVLAFGIILYGIMIVVKKDASALSKATGSLTTGGRVNLLLNDLLTNNKLLLILLVACFCLLVITFIKRRKMNYADRIAIIIGDVLYVIGLFVGGVLLEVSTDIVLLIVMIAINIGISYIIINFYRRMDFKRSEFVQFEDEDYYYFVKAVPKLAIAKTNRQEEVITEKTQNTFSLNMDQLFKHHDDEEGEDAK